METTTGRTRAKLFLGDISQERMKPSHLDGIAVEDYFRPEDPSIVICCDAFCCILDCDKVPRPQDRVSRKERAKQWAPELVLRKEKFGGLVWNRQTGHIWEIGKRETRVCFDLAKGRSLKQVSERHGITESELFQLLADLSQQL